MRSVANNATPLESNEDDFRENCEPEEQTNPQAYTGYCAIFGPWHVHMIEAENPLMSKFIKGLHFKTQEKNSIYGNCWVVHYQEDITAPSYESWICKSYKDQTDPVLKEDTDFDKLIRVYEAMVNIGKEAH